MKLRGRLILSSTVQLLAVGVLLAIAYVGFRQSVLPTLHEHLRARTLDAVSDLRTDLELPLAAEDHEAVVAAVDKYLRDPDIRYLEVRDAEGVEVLRHGTRARPYATGQPLTAYPVTGGIAAWSEISLESVVLGHVQVRYSTARVDRVGTWAAGFAIVAVLVWLAAFAHALRFSRDFVAPIARMMQFSGRVAGGCFTEQLDVAAPGELGELKEHLNGMARDLDSREQERQRSERRAEEMRQELIAVSRMAGMAEVATGVLHNVGNVLNSLNTSVSVTTTRLRNSKVAALAKSVDLYRAHPGGLAAFLGTEKGALLPRFLEKVADQLAVDNTEMQGELESINRHVQHIATIVSTQQSYTRVAAIREVTNLAGVVDDALGMVEASFARHRIEVVKDYRVVPQFVTDRHKVLQIVVNLIANARHAVKDGQHPRIQVSVVPIGGGVELAVEDNGTGIPAELLDRIFQHGFTTKKEGHGFGLHSAANAATELGGKLTVSSPGTDLGARFTLTLLDQPTQVIDALAS